MAVAAYATVIFIKSTSILEFMGVFYIRSTPLKFLICPALTLSYKSLRYYLSANEIGVCMKTSINSPDVITWRTI
jgi:hypothetical protein